MRGGMLGPIKTQLLQTDTRPTCDHTQEEMNASLRFLFLATLLLVQQCVASSASLISRGSRPDARRLQDNTETGASTTSGPEEQSHRQLFWSLVFLVDLLHHPPCPPIGPAHDKCVADRNSDGSSSSSSSSSSYSTESSSSESSSSTNGMDQVGGVPSGLRRFQWFMIVAAAAAVIMAMVAIAMGQRKQEQEQHVLTGSVARRMALFSNFCDSTLCDSMERPSRVVEMTASMDDYHTATDDNVNESMITHGNSNYRGSAMV